MKASCVALLLMLCMESQSQEIKVAPALGFGVASSPLRKNFFIAKELQLGLEKNVGNAGVVSISVGGASHVFTYTDTTGAQVFVGSISFILPVTFRRYNPLSARSLYFLEVGGVPTFYHRERRERRIGGRVEKETGNASGYGLSLLGSIGYKHKVDGITSISLGLNNYLDLVPQNKDREGRLRQNKTLFSIVFYRRLLPKPKPPQLEPL